MLYTVLYMVRMQVYLTEAQRTLLSKKAVALGVPVAALIRRAVDRYLGGEPTGPDYDEVLQRTFGSMPDLEVPPRSEFDRSFAAEAPPTYG